MTNKHKRKASDGDGGAPTTSLTGVLNPREEWTTLDFSVMRTLLDFFDTDLNVKSAFNIRVDALLAGNIMFENNAKSIFSSDDGDEEEAWYNYAYSQFCRDVVRSMWCCGFAPCTIIKDEKYGGKPKVLNLRYVDIEYRNNAYGEPEWLYYDKQEVQYEREPMDNVHTFYWPESVPTDTGEYRSLMMTLISELAYEDQLRSCDIIATSSRCNPPLVTENIPETYNPETLSSALEKITNKTGTGVPTAPTMSVSNGLIDNRQMAQMMSSNQKISDTLAMLNAYNTSNVHLVEGELQKQFRKRFQAPDLAQYYLANNRKYVGHQLAEGPGEMVLKVQQQRAERVFTLLGVPPAMLNQTNTLTSSKKSLTESSMLMFHNAQRLLKQQLIMYMTRMYQLIHTFDQALKLTLRGAQNGKEVDEKELKAATDVSITLPGLPTDGDLDKMWKTGVLKYDLYCDYLSSKHGIPRNGFNPKQLLTCEDLNGIKELEDKVTK